MDKYEGCNRVESSAVELRVSKRHSEKRRAKSRSSFLLRIVVAAVAVTAILAVCYIDIPIFAQVKAALRGVFCYDLFGRTNFGTSVLFSA